MKVERDEEVEDGFILHATRQEMSIIGGCMVEALNLTPKGFAVRNGFSREQGQELFKSTFNQLNAFYPEQVRHDIGRQYAEGLANRRRHDARRAEAEHLAAQRLAASIDHGDAVPVMPPAECAVKLYLVRPDRIYGWTPWPESSATEEPELVLTQAVDQTLHALDVWPYLDRKIDGASNWHFDFGEATTIPVELLPKFIGALEQLSSRFRATPERTFISEVPSLRYRGHLAEVQRDTVGVGVAEMLAAFAAMTDIARTAQRSKLPLRIER